MANLEDKTKQELQRSGYHSRIDQLSWFLGLNAGLIFATIGFEILANVKDLYPNKVEVRDVTGDGIQDVVVTRDDFFPSHYPAKKIFFIAKDGKFLRAIPHSANGTNFLVGDDGSVYFLRNGYYQLSDTTKSEP